LLSDTTTICAGDSFLLKFPEDQVSKVATYNWQTPKSIIVHSKQLYIKYKGLHIVKIYDGKKLLIDSTYLKINEKPRLKMRDTVLCGGPIIISTKNLKDIVRLCYNINGYKKGGDNNTSLGVLVPINLLLNENISVNI
jgi:hypothetical protein